MNADQRVRLAVEQQLASDESSGGPPTEPPWGDPRPLPKLLPVEAFEPGLLPAGLRDWTVDVAERVGCPVEFTAASSLVAAGSAIGRARGIHPRCYDDGWTVIPNLWGALVGAPGEKKSPALKEALAPVRELERAAREANAQERAAYDAEFAIHKAQRDAFVVKARKRGDRDALTAELRALDDQAPKEPAARRLLINDATVEAVALVLEANPRGVLQSRDELVGWFASFDKPGHENDRQFYLEAWEGNGEYSFDRISRRSGYIRGVCLGVLGTIQPGPLAEYFRASANGGASHDGLMQRFQLLVYPDAAPNRLGCDRAPNDVARARYNATFAKLGELPDPTSEVPALRFDHEAQEFMDVWARDLESAIRAAEQEHEALGAHFAKYRSLGPALALISHLCESTSSAVSLNAATRAAAICGWLESHARRVYGAALAGPVAAAELLLSRLQKTADLPHPFVARDVYRRGWSGLAHAATVEAALNTLESHGWVQGEDVPSAAQGGRPTRIYRAHPSIRRMA